MWDRTPFRTPIFCRRHLPAEARRMRYRPAGNFGEIGGFARGGHAKYNSLQALFRSQTGAIDIPGGLHLEPFDRQRRTGQLVGQLQPASNYRSDRSRVWTRATPTSIVRISSWRMKCCTSQAATIQQTCAADTGWMGGQQHLHDGRRQLPHHLYQWRSFGCSGQRREQWSERPCGNRLPGEPAAAGDSNQLHCGTDWKYIREPAALYSQRISYSEPSPLTSRAAGPAQGAPNTNFDGQLAKNWYIKEKYRIKFSMDFFNLFNHPNFNSSNLEGSLTIHPLLSTAEVRTEHMARLVVQPITSLAG